MTMDTSNTRLYALICCAALSGCAMQGFTPEETAIAGAAVRSNVAQQTIDPAAGQQPTNAAPTDAAKTVAAIERYRKDDGKVVQDDSLI
jgi:hypothetical protein